LWSAIALLWLGVGAAGLLLLAGYNGAQPMQDPFCGSGTIAIEAAWIAQNRAAGLMRRFGFEQFNTFDKALWTKLKAAARAVGSANCSAHCCLAAMLS